MSVVLAATLIAAVAYVMKKPETIAEPVAVAATESEDQRINNFFEAVFEREISLSPIRQSSLGRKTDQLGKWDDFSDLATSQRVERIRADYERLESDFDIEALGDDARLSYDLFALNAERAIRNFEFDRNHYVVDQFNGQLSGLLTVLQNNHPIDSRQDAEDYISRIAALETVLQEMTLQLQDRASFGVIAPAFSFADVINDARSIASGAPIQDTPRDNAVFVDFRDKLNALNLDADTTDDLLMSAAAALKGPFARGFAMLVAEIERQQPLVDGDRGVWSLPNGAEFYRNRIYHHTTLDMGADEIHSIGLQEVERLHEEMRGIRDIVGFDGTLREFFNFIREDPNNYFDDSDAGREDFLRAARQQVSEIYEVVEDYFYTLPSAELEVRRVEPWRENSTSIAFYNRPSEDGSRPGIYYANLADMTSVQKYVFTAITYHESVPGHHFQIALAQELEGLPSFRKYSGYGAFTEGWALYAEQLAKEMGFYADPYHDFGRLQNELWRSVRLVLDTGIHAKRWTRKESIDYFLENTPLSEGDIVTEVERFFVNPGQALGYKMGMIKILELRERAKNELGNAYDIREFHDAVIGAGSLPLQLLEQQVERYISAKH
ncbi:MAG: hypothetical protein ACI88G_002184 [Woeseiaceae bacterium]|jgi:uncharacterized protein (DUF885 family)